MEVAEAWKELQDGAAKHWWRLFFCFFFFFLFAILQISLFALSPRHRIVSTHCIHLPVESAKMPLTTPIFQVDNSLPTTTFGLPYTFVLSHFSLVVFLVVVVVVFLLLLAAAS